MSEEVAEPAPSRHVEVCRVQVGPYTVVLRDDARGGRTALVLSFGPEAPQRIVLEEIGKFDGLSFEKAVNKHRKELEAFARAKDSEPLEIAEERRSMRRLGDLIVTKVFEKEIKAAEKAAKKSSS